ncbi:hypothetical protein MN0502_14800 [Arthrobacter sp. MN05-02]|nr:hypothetical protein MN0502_14800 [Arthrobacter sp. MN05-02]
MPDEYHAHSGANLDVSSQGAVNLHSAYARDRGDGMTTASNFHDTVTLHHLIHPIQETSDSFFSSSAAEVP